jgi:hypothetical protein
VTVALFVDPKGPYPQLLGADKCWDITRDARNYFFHDPVIAHPPCQLWTNMAKVNYKRYKDRSPEHEERLRPGNDGGCFAHALLTVRRCGGVLEHPAGSHAWKEFGLVKPTPGRWELHVGGTEARHYPACAYWVAEVCQATYGHRAQKMTWLLYAGQRPPFDLNWDVREGTHQIGWFDRIKPTCGKREASETPLEFAKLLTRLAKWSQG